MGVNKEWDFFVGNERLFRMILYFFKIVKLFK